MKIYNTIQNSGTLMHFLDQNLKIKNDEQLKHRSIMNEILWIYGIHCHSDGHAEGRFKGEWGGGPGGYSPPSFPPPPPTTHMHTHTHRLYTIARTFYLQCSK